MQDVGWEMQGGECRFGNTGCGREDAGWEWSGMMGKGVRKALDDLLGGMSLLQNQAKGNPGCSRTLEQGSKASVPLMGMEQPKLCLPAVNCASILAAPSGAAGAGLHGHYWDARRAGRVCGVSEEERGTEGGWRMNFLASV